MLQSKSKSIIIIISTLLLGVVLGLMSGRFFIHNRIANLSGMKDADGFVNVMEKVIRPSKEHSEIIREILIDHHKEIREFRKQNIVKMQVIMDSLKTDLKPYLTDKQQERLEDMRSRRASFGKPPFHQRQDIKHQGKEL